MSVIFSSFQLYEFIIKKHYEYELFNKVHLVVCFAKSKNQDLKYTNEKYNWNKRTFDWVGLIAKLKRTYHSTFHVSFQTQFNILLFHTHKQFWLNIYYVESNEPCQSTFGTTIEIKKQNFASRILAMVL